MFRRVGMTIPTVFLAICSAFIPAIAGDYHNHSGEHRHHSQAKPSVVGGDGLPSYVSRIGTYAGSISAVRFKRNGIYFSADRGMTYFYAQGRTDAVKPRIIHVNGRSAKTNCSYEAGVCVIRP